MKKLLSILLACVVAISLFACGGKYSDNSQQNNVKDIENTFNYKYGDYIKVLNVIEVGSKICYINPIYNSCFQVAVKQNDKDDYYYYDVRGNKIDNYKKSINGYYKYSDNGKSGLKDENEKIVLKAEYDMLEICNESNNFVALKDKNFYIYDSKLNKIFNYKMDKIWWVKSIKTGNINYVSIPNIKEGLINIYNNKNMWGYVDLKGRTIIDFKYNLAFSFSNGYATVVGKNKQDEYKWGLIDKKSNLIIDYQYDKPLTFKNGIMIGNKDNIGYYININNERVLNGLLFDETNNFSEGLAAVKKNGKWGYIDTNGSEVFPCIFDEADQFSGGVALAAYNNNVVMLTYLDVLPFDFSDADVDNAYAKLNQIDGSLYWTDLRRKQENKYNKENWDSKDYKDDFNYTLTYKEVQPNTWYVTDAGVWYYFENDRTTRKTGWYNEPKDGQTYYLNPTNSAMATGWTEIDGDMYYFHEGHSSTPNWYYIPESDSWESHGMNIKSYGALYKDETTPDGKKVDKDGKLIK